MRKIKPKFAYDDNGKKAGVVLTIKEFEQLVDELEDYQDYLFVKGRSWEGKKTFTPKQAMNEILRKK